MNYNEITSAIHRMAYKRYLRGQAQEQVINHLKQLYSTTWKNNSDIREFILNVILEFENLIIIRPFGICNYLVIGNGFTKEITVINEREIIIR